MCDADKQYLCEGCGLFKGSHAFRAIKARGLSPVCRVCEKRHGRARFTSKARATMAELRASDLRMRAGRLEYRVLQLRLGHVG